MITPAIILGLLVLPWFSLTLAGRLRDRPIFDRDTRGCLGLILVFVFTGVGHFIKTEPMAEMLPGWVPLRIPLVYATGVLELVLGIALVRPRRRANAGWALVVLLVLFLPVNIYAALNRLGMGGHRWGPAYLLIRVPLQLLLVGWTWWFAIRPRATEPIRFTCRDRLGFPPAEIARQILDLSKWPEFGGYGPLPGIQSAEFENRTENIVGTRIRVTNTDGSQHTEEIVVWEPEQRLQLHMRDFTPPLSRFAAGFDETWEFTPENGVTHVARSFAMHPKSAAARVLLGLIALLLKRAIAKHLRQLRGGS